MPLLGGPFFGWALWGTLGLVGLGAWLVVPGGAARGERVAGLALALFFTAYLATIVLTVTSMRARLVLVPLVLPFAGWLVARAPELLARHRLRLALAAAPALAAIAIGKKPMMSVRAVISTGRSLE